MFNQIKIDLHTSRLLACLFALPVLSSIALFFSSELSHYFKIVHLFGALALLTYLIRQHALLYNASSVQSIVLKGQQFFLILNNQHHIHARLRSRTLIMPWLCLLYFEVLETDRTFLRGLMRYRFVLAFHYNTEQSDSLRRLRARILHDFPALTHKQPLPIK